MNVNLTLVELQWLDFLLAMSVNQIGDNKALVAKIVAAIDQHGEYTQADADRELAASHAERNTL